MNNPGPDHAFRLTFQILSGQHEVKGQYLIYDMNAFIADIGGFLGLLLGHSVYSVFGEILDGTKAVISRHSN